IGGAARRLICRESRIICASRKLVFRLYVGCESGTRIIIAGGIYPSAVKVYVPLARSAESRIKSVENCIETGDNGRDVGKGIRDIREAVIVGGCEIVFRVLLRLLRF